LVLINGGYLFFIGTYPFRINNNIKKNGWFFKEIMLASLALKFKWFLSLMEGAFICGMRHKINEMDSPLGDKGACERRPKSKKEGPNGGLRY
jgi:hypothetical protein